MSSTVGKTTPDVDPSATTGWTSVLDNGSVYHGDDVVGPKPWSEWRQPFYGVVLLSFAYAMVTVVGVVSNGLVIGVVCMRPPMRTVTNYFLVNLATADVLVCVFVLPVTLLQNVFSEWWFGPTICRVAPYLQGVSVGASVNTLVAVAIERYKAVYFPKTTKMSPCTAAIVIVVTWLAPALLFVPWLFVYRQKTFIHDNFDFIVCHAEWGSVTAGRAFTVGIVMVTCYLVPLACNVFIYVLIAARVRSRQNDDVMVRLGSNSRAAMNIRRSTTRLLRMLVVVVALFAVSWLPLYVVQLRDIFASVEEVSDVERHVIRTYVVPLAQWLGAANSGVNPFVYCYFNSGFRDGVVHLIGTALGRVRKGGERTEMTSMNRTVTEHAVITIAL